MEEPETSREPAEPGGGSSRTVGTPPIVRIAIGLGAMAALAAVSAMVLALTPRSDEPQDPDAVVVLGGEGYERSRLGIELSDQHDAQLILSSSAVWYGEKLGRDCTSDTRCITPDPETTRGEARAIAQLVESEGWRHVTVATSTFHTTRARLLFRQCLGDQVSVVGAHPGKRVGAWRHLREVAGVVAATTVQRAC